MIFVNNLSSINRLSSGSSFFDNSSPKKLVTIQENLESAAYKFEFSYDNITWERNPNLNLQQYYKYKFDTSNYYIKRKFSRIFS